jgi:hypothetical protein
LSARLLVRAAPSMVVEPDDDEGPFLIVYVTNIGMVPVTITSFMILTDAAHPLLAELQFVRQRC